LGLEDITVGTMMLKKMTVAAFALAMMTGGAMAQVAADCGPLPNAKWSWVITYGEPTTDTSTTFGDISYAGGSGNGFADVTTTTTTITPVNCTALNPAGVPNADKSTTTTITSTESSTVEKVKVCAQTGADLAGSLCTQ
jgi:hypothetical protein